MRYHLQLIGMAFLWGAAWSFAQVVLKYVPPLTAAGIRFIIASVFLFGWLCYREGAHTLRILSSRQWLWLLWAAVFGIFGYAIFFMYALKYVPAGKASTIVSINPVPILILGAILYKERLNIGIGLGMIIAVLGSMIAIAQGNPLAAFSGGTQIGTYLLLCTLACWTAYTLVARKLEGISSLAVTFATALIGSILLLIAGGIIEGTQAWVQVIQAPMEMWLNMLCLSLGAGAVAYLWYFAGLQGLGVGTAATYMVLIPVFGILISAIWLGEPLTLFSLLGTAMVVIGMLLMNWAKKFT